MTDREVGHAALGNHTAIGVVDIQNPVELAEADDDGIGSRNRTAGQRRARAPGHDIDASLVSETEHLRDLVRRRRQRHGKRLLAIRRQRIRLIGLEPQGLLDDAVGRQQAAQARDDLIAPGEDGRIGCGHANH